MNAARHDVVVTGAGAVSPLGDSPAKIADALAAGQSGLREVALFETAGLPVRLGGEVPGFSAQPYLTPGNLRPLDRTAQLATVAAQLALDAAGLGAEARRAHEAGLVLGTVFGSIHTISAFDRRALEAGPIYAKPLDFANSVINAAAGQTAIWHGLPGINSTICAGTASGLEAVVYAADRVRAGRSRALLAGGAEELCFESFLGFQRTGRVAGSQDGAVPRAVPFDAGRNGFLLAEGAALVLLEDGEAAAARGAKVLARVVGQATAFDPGRGADPEAAGEALARAIALALEEAGATPDEVTAISSSASGSPATDAAEAAGLALAFGARLAALPLTAAKAGLGEGLGVGGALMVLVLLEAMSRGILPGLPGFETLDPALPRLAVGAAPQVIRPGLGLATAVSFDGHAAALLLAPAGRA